MTRTLRFLSVLDVFLAAAALAPPARADMPHNDMPHNSVSLQGLTKAAPLLDALANGPLADATISAAIAAHPAVKDPDVGPLVGKIVSCALDSGTTLLPFPAPPQPTELAGELGLCGKNSPFGNWHAAALADPDKKKGCLEAVTACVLARVNALGHRIVISVRSRSPEMPFKLQKQVPVETQYRDKKKVASFEACSGSGPDCGFAPQFVGRCTPGAQVKVKAAAANAGIRICKGLYGCDTLQPMPPYTGVVVASQVGSAQFSCPSGGYYSVMTRPSSAVKANKGRYPASEKSVFGWPEGGFYGNIFRTDFLARVAEKYRETKGPAVLAGDQNACFSPVWVDGVAQMNDRFCAGVPGCFVNNPMPCFKAPSDRCAANAVASQAFGKCKPIASASSEPVWDRVITTYLNDPCDLSAQEKCDPKKIVRGRPRGSGDDDGDDHDHDDDRPRAKK
jgi:hypothetical protein